MTFACDYRDLDAMLTLIRRVNITRSQDLPNDVHQDAVNNAGASSPIMEPGDSTSQRTSQSPVCFWIDATKLCMDVALCQYLANVVSAHYLLHHEPVHPKVQSLLMVDTAPEQVPVEFVERYERNGSQCQLWQRVYHMELVTPNLFRYNHVNVEVLRKLCSKVQERKVLRPEWGNTLVLMDMSGTVITNLNSAPEFASVFTSSDTDSLLIATAMGTTSTEVRNYLSTTLGDHVHIRMFDALDYFNRYIEPLCISNSTSTTQLPHPRTYCPSQWWYDALCSQH